MDIPEFLEQYRDEIIREWTVRLHGEVSPKYSALPMKMLNATCSAAFDANFVALAKDDFTKIDTVVEKIGDIRSEAGFSLSDVQKAFELYRSILLKALSKRFEGDALVDILERLNHCLGYTIHRFSDYFQILSEREIRNYAQRLELMVEKRTKELARSEANYRTLVEEIHDGYFVNQSGRIAFANRAFCGMHGYLLEEVIGRPYTDFVAVECLGEVREIYERRMLKGHSRETYVYSRLHKNGSCLPTENTVAITFYQGAVAAIGICRDITERMEIEKRIREAEHLAHIGHLTTSLAHEIRNPLSSAKMGIRMLLKNPLFTGKEKRRLEILSEEVSRLDRIVTEMLDFAKPIKYDFKKASVIDLIDSCLEIIEAKIMEKDITVNKVFSRNIPGVMIDVEKIEQVIINILLNAIEAVDASGEIGIVVKRQRSGKGSVLVEVADTGGGVGGDVLPYIFDPFFSKKTKGTGLGLANAKKIVEAHGGSIRATPVDPRGVCLSFTLPTWRQAAQRGPSR